ncbi:hypothetical protein QFZ72_000105 [Bacillus sp. V2I10]|nr:hypothetical protein [Bacillus sp. V2I10]
MKETTVGRIKKELTIPLKTAEKIRTKCGSSCLF